jgi:hypothetical protein
MFLLAAFLARADTYYLESQQFTDRESAVRVESAAEAAGFEARVVRRFRLGQGWGFVALVEGLSSPEAANAARQRLDGTGASLTPYRVEGSRKAEPIAPAPPVAVANTEVTASEWLARARAAHGGSQGGAARLAQAGAVHFTFQRELDLEGTKTRVEHDYWREGSLRRLQVAAPAPAVASLAVVGRGAAWIAAGDRVDARDVGVMLGATDEMAPESVLAVAMDVTQLLTDTDRFAVLDGAESGVRLGVGDDTEESSLSWVELDRVSGRLVQVRYVTAGGPVTYELSDYADFGDGLVVPRQVRIRRPEGRGERIEVGTLALSAHAPAHTFDRPAALVSP